MSLHIAQPVTKGINGFFKVIDENQAIEQNIIAILFTEPNERFMRNNIGTPIRSQLWDPVDDITISAIRTFIRQQVAIHEPRVQLLNVAGEIVDTVDGQSSQIRIALNYRILSTNQLKSISSGVLIRKRVV